MATVEAAFGRLDHGRRVTRAEVGAVGVCRGYRAEVIGGRLYVSPRPSMAHAFVVSWLRHHLDNYSRRRPDVVNFIAGRAEVWVPDRDEETIPEPDLAVFAGVVLGDVMGGKTWCDYSPLLVAEVLSPDSIDKDLTRNVELYLAVPSIREYWVIDPLTELARPEMRVYRRRGAAWQRPIDVAGGDTYTTKLLPGFSLTLDLHS